MATHSKSEQLVLNQFKMVLGDARIKTNVCTQDKYITIRCYTCLFWRQFAVSPGCGKCYFCLLARCLCWRVNGTPWMGSLSVLLNWHCGRINAHSWSVFTFQRSLHDGSTDAVWLGCSYGKSIYWLRKVKQTFLTLSDSYAKLLKSASSCPAYVIWQYFQSDTVSVYLVSVDATYLLCLLRNTQCNNTIPLVVTYNDFPKLS